MTLPPEDLLIPLLTRGWTKKSRSVETGPGDDCAVVRLGKERLLLKTDAVVEGVHFLPSTSPSLIGRKALARVLSDVAAMGGTPTHALVTLAVPPRADARRLAAIYRGLTALARRHRVALVGGETTRAPKLLLSVALLGTCQRAKPVLRSGGKPGDELWVTGTLGATRKRRHLHFEPRLAEGRWLAERGAARAMMDLSDGLAADLPRLAAASRCHFALNRASLPLAPGATTAAALGDGEDFELLLAVPPAQRALLEKWPFRTRLTRIGRLLPLREPSTPLGDGFDHFARR